MRWIRKCNLVNLFDILKSQFVRRNLLLKYQINVLFIANKILAYFRQSDES